MDENNDYVYGSDILNDSYCNKLISKKQKKELSDRVSPIYYFNPSTIRENNFYDKNNRLELNAGDVIDYRFEIDSKLGKGAFGNVYLAKDHKRRYNVAIKVIRNERRFHRQVQIETEILELFYSTNDYCKNVIKLFKTFTFRGDIFLVFEDHGIDMYKYYRHNLIDSNDVKSFAKQIATGLEFIHSFNIIHMDLKPENILVKNKQLKIIDLGSSIKERENMFKSYVQSRYYRSPDVVFKLQTTTKIDIWSYGCIIYELSTSIPLIPAKNTNDLVIYYTHIMGYPSKDLNCFYDADDYFDPYTKELNSFNSARGKCLYPNTFKWNTDNITMKQFINSCCLLWNPLERFTASKLLEHPYLSEDPEVASNI